MIVALNTICHSFFVEFWVPTDMTLNMVAETCQLVIALLIGSKQVPDSPLSAFRALTSGEWHTLLGVAENDWFEAKQSMYGLEDTHACHELALDVASFANGDRGGLIAIGLKTSKGENGQDIVSAVDGLSKLNVSIARVEDILHQRIHPSPRSLSMVVVQRNQRKLLLLLIPPQNREEKPFLVSGTTVDNGRLYGGGFTWVERRGASKRSFSTAHIQSLLRNGLSKSQFDS